MVGGNFEKIISFSKIDVGWICKYVVWLDKWIFITDNRPLLGFVSRPFLLHLPLADHDVKHLQPGVEPLARLAAGEDDAPLVVPAQLSQ